MLAWYYYLLHVVQCMCVVLTIRSVEEICWCYHSNETFSAVQCPFALYDFLIKQDCGQNPIVSPFTDK